MNSPTRSGVLSDREWEIIFDSATEGFARIRRTLILILAVFGLGIFHLYMWYGSWELARLAGRQGVIREIERLNAEGKTSLGTMEGDNEAITVLKIESAALQWDRSEAHFEMPLIGFRISGSDLPIALEITGVAALIWLIFNQRRTNLTLRRIQRAVGWRLPVAMLEYHFGLIGSHASRGMRWLGRVLPLCLPILGLLTFASDLFDIRSLMYGELTSLAFTSGAYVTRVIARIVCAASLFLCLLALGIWSYREWQSTEEELLRYSEAEHLEDPG